MTGARRLDRQPPTGLTVFFDQHCPLCQRCQVWLAKEPTWVPIRFAASDDAPAQALAEQVPWLGTELVVVADDGATWVGPAAFVTCLWATRRYRSWSRRMAGPALAPLAERFFVIVSTNRGRLGAALEPTNCTTGQCSVGADPGADPR